MKKKHQKRLDKMVAGMSDRKKEKLLARMAEIAISLNGHEHVLILGPGGKRSDYSPRSLATAKTPSPDFLPRSALELHVTALVTVSLMKNWFGRGACVRFTAA